LAYAGHNQAKIFGPDDGLHRPKIVAII